jgi:hypothetical protein
MVPQIAGIVLMTEIESADRVERRKLSSRFRRRAALIALSEFGLVVGAVAVFFVFLTVLIRVYFPQGTSLGENQSWSTALLPDAGDVDRSTAWLEFPGMERGECR